jgi:hypothetical protein
MNSEINEKSYSRPNPNKLLNLKYGG